MDIIIYIYIKIYVNALKNNMATELHIPISHLDKSRFFCAPALSLSLCLQFQERETEEEKWSISKRSLEGRPKGKEENNMKRRQGRKRRDN